MVDDLLFGADRAIYATKAVGRDPDRLPPTSPLPSPAAPNAADPTSKTPIASESRRGG
jgi:hypothetical protein